MTGEPAARATDVDGEAPPPGRPPLRHMLSPQDWIATAQTAAEDSWVLLAHWAEPAAVHALYLDPATAGVVPVSIAIEAGAYPALSPLLPAAALYERMILDLFGHVPGGAVDPRPWLDHGAWPSEHPMAAPSAPRTDRPAPAAPAEQPDAMILPLGPIGRPIGEAALLRLTLDGPVIRRADSRLGFTHKGTLALMRNKSPRTAARFAARLSGDATVAHGLAFAEAAETAVGTAAPPRAARLRVVMLELERIAGHLDTIAEVSRLAGAASMRAACQLLREILLRACHFAFGHRLMMDCVVPGGVAVDLTPDGASALLQALGAVAARLPALRRDHEGVVPGARLSGTGRAGRALAESLGVGGVAGRAAGRAFDARVGFMPGYRTLAVTPAVRPAGDAAARQAVRIAEIGASLRLVSSVLEPLPPGPLTVALPQVCGEGIGCAESIRGDVWHWLRIDHGQITAAFPRDPGWALWPLATALLQDSVTDDVELIRASLALPASGMDL